MVVCDDVRRLAYFFLDGTIGPHKADDLLKHLALCGDCDTYLKVEQRLRGFIRERLRPTPAPDRLRERIRESFRA